MKITRVLGLMLLSVTALWAQPFSINCPIDGMPMYFTHQAGYGDNAFCWYSHTGLDPQTGRFGTHEAYVPCGRY